MMFTRYTRAFIYNWGVTNVQGHSRWSIIAQVFSCKLSLTVEKSGIVFDIFVI